MLIKTCLSTLKHDFMIRNSDFLKKGVWNYCVLYESLWRKPGWRFTASSQYCCSGILKVLRSAYIRDFCKCGQSQDFSYIAVIWFIPSNLDILHWSLISPKYWRKWISEWGFLGRLFCSENDDFFRKFRKKWNSFKIPYLRSEFNAAQKLRHHSNSFYWNILLRTKVFHNIAGSTSPPA